MTLNASLILGAIGILFLAITQPACKPLDKSVRNYRYFDKNIQSLDSLALQLKEPVIQKNDQLAITVSSASLNQEQAQVFNLMTSSQGSGSQPASVMGYLVDYDGKLTLPIIGSTQAAGLTKKQLNDSLVYKLAGYVKNPVINIRYLNYRVLLMGEVVQKGWVNFQNERATIVEAIAGSGGLTDLASRENILLIRQHPNGSMETHRLDLNDARIFASPYYQLQQNDVVYVLPNESKLIQIERANSPFFRDLPVYMGLVSGILAFVTLIITATK